MRGLKQFWKRLKASMLHSPLAYTMYVVAVSAGVGNFDSNLTAASWAFLCAAWVGFTITERDRNIR